MTYGDDLKLNNLRLSDFQYDLPPSLIARYPLPERTASRLLCLDRKKGSVAHRSFVDLIDLVTSYDLLVCNNTRVIAARLLGSKETGGHIEVLVERILDDKHMLAQIRASKTPKPNARLYFQNNVCFTVLKRQGDLFLLHCEEDKPVLDVIEAIGQIPIPPYFDRVPDEHDKERYQTIYAEKNGSVAAPTAGLHFDAAFLKKLSDKGVEIGYVTLHVGAGTFAPVRVDDITKHAMHSEYMEVSSSLCHAIRQTKSRGGRVLAVGTTTARCLETAGRQGIVEPFFGETDIFIYPGYSFQAIDALLTNFHLPGSTLLMLVAAFGGYSPVMAAYKEAILHNYRFYSYGDAMWIE